MEVGIKLLSCLVLENLLCSEDLFAEITDPWCEIFLVNHIKTSNHLSERFVFNFGGFLDVSKNLLNMRFSNNLKSSQDQHKLKMWSVFLELVDNSLDDLELLCE